MNLSEETTTALANRPVWPDVITKADTTTPLLVEERKEQPGLHWLITCRPDGSTPFDGITFFGSVMALARCGAYELEPTG
jgi:hypothetical protein